MTKHLRLPPLICCLLVPAMAPTQAAAQPRLNQLAARLAEGPASLQADLARIALSELAAVYADEAQRAQQDMRRHPDDHNLHGWAAGVQRLSNDYATLADTVSADTPIELGIGPDHSLNLIVAGRLAVISSPRMNEQAAFEQRIIGQFCTLNRCEDLLDDPVASEGVDSTSPPPQWNFSDQAGPVCTSDDGLEFQFRTLDNLDRKRAACASAVTELHRLSSAITRETATGIRVDWGTLAIYSRPDPDQQKVVLNSNGDSVQLSLPFLAAQQELFAMVRPWLAANVRDERYTLVVINAGRLLAPPGQALE
jgi:hypothetical protein